jgi:hypothetical protein
MLDLQMPAPRPYDEITDDINILLIGKMSIRTARTVRQEE